MKLIIEHVKNSFSSLPVRFWIREYSISIILFTLLAVYVYTFYKGIDFFQMMLFILVNAILFPFTKFLFFQLKQWWYEYVYQVDPNSVLRSIGLFVLIIKALKNIFFFFFSFILGLAGFVLLILVAPKTNIEVE